jgi:hypothetical protein
MTYRYTSNIEYNPLRAIVTEIERGIKVAFDVIPLSKWQEDTPEGIKAWTDSQNCAWTIAEGVAEYLEVHPEVNLMTEGSKEVWQRVRDQWYEEDVDHEVDLAEAKREWEGVQNG